MCVKQVIVVRRDLRLRRAALASVVAKAASQFFLYNDESDSVDRIELHLSKIESEWISNGGPKFIVLGVSSRGALDRISFKADVEGISVYSVTSHVSQEDGGESDNGEELVAIVLGPDECDVIDKITGKLKLL